MRAPKCTLLLDNCQRAAPWKAELSKGFPLPGVRRALPALRFPLPLGSVVCNAHVLQEKLRLAIGGCGTREASLILSLLLKAWMRSKLGVGSQGFAEIPSAIHWQLHPLPKGSQTKSASICQTPKAGQRLMGEGIPQQVGR